MEEVFQKLTGIILIILGFLGLFLPFLQGIILILLGLAMLFPKKIKIKRITEAIKNRFK